MNMNEREFRGTRLRASDLTEGKVFLTSWTREAEYAWDCGIAISRFLEGLKQGVILGVRCPRCQLIMTPPRVWCSQCFRPVNQYVPLRDTGVIKTFSISYVRWDTKRLRKPEIPAVIEIDGASPGMGFLHLIGGVNPKYLRIGMKVKAVWEPPERRTGSIRDIRYFRPYGGK